MSNLPNALAPGYCRKQLIAAGLPHPKSNCDQCGSILASNWKCPLGEVSVGVDLSSRPNYVPPPSSPTFTGTPVAPTTTTSANTAQISPPKPPFWPENIDWICVKTSKRLRPCPLCNGVSLFFDKAHYVECTGCGTRTPSFDQELHGKHIGPGEWDYLDPHDWAVELWNRRPLPKGPE